MTDYRDEKLTEYENKRIDKFQKSLPDAPVDIVGLAEDFGLEVWRVKLPIDTSGVIRKEDDIYAIYADEDDSVERRRFTYAHELAHFLLHKEDIGNGVSENTLFRSNLSNSKEIEANKIAADILMPSSVLNELAETRKYGVRELAKVFKVSRSAMLVRLGIPA